MPSHDTNLFGPLDDNLAASLTALHADLVARAERLGLLDIAYDTVDSPVGPLLVAATERGLVRVAYAIEDHDRVLTQLASVVSARMLRSRRRLEPTSRQLDEYFRGSRTSFSVPLDLRLTSGFRRVVIENLHRISYGSTSSYAGVAADVGNARAVRAVGTACATNPLPIVVPCHRVIRSDGSFGQYIGGVDAKRRLLDLEATRQPPQCDHDLT